MHLCETTGLASLCQGVLEQRLPRHQPAEPHLGVSLQLAPSLAIGGAMAGALKE